MPVMVSSSGGGGADFTPAPIGLHRGVCCDIVDLGYLDTQWGKKRKIDLKVQIAVDMDTGKPFLVSKRYNATLGQTSTKKSNLLSDLEGWRGREFTEQEAKLFDLETLIGVQCQVNIVHNEGTRGGTFANISAIVPGVKGLPAMLVRDYTRVCKRDGYQAPDMTPPDEPPPSVAPSDEPPQHGEPNDATRDYARRMTTDVNKVIDDDIPF